MCQGCAQVTTTGPERGPSPLVWDVFLLTESTSAPDSLSTIRSDEGRFKVDAGEGEATRMGRLTQGHAMGDGFLSLVA